MTLVKFIRGNEKKLPDTKDSGSFYIAKDSGKFWAGSSQLIKEPKFEGFEGNILCTDGEGTRYWADASLYPTPKNRQIAPLYTNVEDLGLIPSLVFSNGIDSAPSDETARRIPALIIGNDSTYYIACEARTSLSDSSQISIVFGKRKPTDTAWAYQNLFVYSSTDKYKYMNPSFAIDRNGVEKEGRLYIFCMRFQITDSNKGSWINLDGSETTNVYRYSDDNGETWSEVQDIGNAWGSSWKFATISDTNSIFLNNGTLVCPLMGHDTSGNAHSGIVYKKSGETQWTYSSLSPVNGENECTIFENNEKLYVNTRNTTTSRCVYEYDFDTDSYSLIDKSFTPYNACSADIDQATIDNVHMYTMTFIDTEDGPRANPTVWVSTDGIIFAKAIKLLDKVVGANAGYCITSSYNNYVYSVYEDDGKIYGVDLTSCRNILINSASFLTLTDQNVLNVTKSNRYTALSYLYTNSTWTSDAVGTPLGGWGNEKYVSLLKYATYSSYGKHINIQNGNEEHKDGWQYLYLDVKKYRGRELVVSIGDGSAYSGCGITDSAYSTSGNTFLWKKGGTGKGWDITQVTVTVPDNAVTLYLDYIYNGTHGYTPTLELVANS